MINIQEQVKLGFNHLSSEIRSLSSSVQPEQRISETRHKSIEYNRKKSIEYNRQESDNPNDSSDENDNFGADDEQEDIEEISHMHEDSFSEEECEDSKSQKEAQKQLVKRTRKEIRVCYYAYIIDFLKINNCFFLSHNYYFIERNKNLITKCEI